MIKKCNAFWYETGQLLSEDDSDYEAYTVSYDHKHGLFDTDWGAVIDEEKSLDNLKLFLSDMVKNEKNMYAIIESSFSIDYDTEAVVETKHGFSFVTDTEVLASFKVEDVEWSIANFDGKIIENFIEGQRTN